MEYVILYWLSINLIGILITVYDKLAARKGARRISEKCLFVYALLGASVCMYITMKMIRHKTLHKRFMIGFPIIIVLKILLVALLVYKFA